MPLEPAIKPAMRDANLPLSLSSRQEDEQSGERRCQEKGAEAAETVKEFADQAGRRVSARVRLAETYDVTLRTAVRADIGPDDAILKEIARRKSNLVVIGVARRPGEKLFFGDTAAALLEKSKSSLLFLAS